MLNGATTLVVLVEPASGAVWNLVPIEHLARPPGYGGRGTGYPSRSARPG